MNSPTSDQFVPCRRVGDGSQHHFFGYYNKSNWDKTNRLLLAQATGGLDLEQLREVNAMLTADAEAQLASPRQ